MYEFRFHFNLLNTNYNLAKASNFTTRFIDDLACLNNPFFEKHITDIYPASLILNPGNDNPLTATFLDTRITITNEHTIECKVYDKRDDFPFEINAFPCTCSNISIRNATEVYTSQLNRAAIICSHLHFFHEKHSKIVIRLIKNGFERKRLINKFKKFTEDKKKLTIKYNYTPQDIKTYIKEAYVDLP
jgi:hypothetical protein